MPGSDLGVGWGFPAAPRPWSSGTSEPRHREMVSRATWKFLEVGNSSSCAAGAGSPLPAAGNAGAFLSGEVLVGANPPGMVPGGDLEVPLVRFWRGREGFYFVC